MTAMPHRRYALLVSYYFPPSNAVASRRLAAIAQVLRESGMDVLVVSNFGGPRFTEGQGIGAGIYAFPVADPPRRLLDGFVRLKRWLAGVAQTPVHESERRARDEPARSPSPSALDRLSAAVVSVLGIVDQHKWWSIRAYRAALRAANGRPVRIVVASGPPHSPLLAARLIAQRLNVPFAPDFRDPIYPGPDTKASRIHIREWLLNRLENAILSRAAAVTCASPGIARGLAARHPPEAAKVTVVLNGFDGVVKPPPESTGHRLVVVFAGELYMNRDPFPFLECCEELVNERGVDTSRIAVQFVGHCEYFGNQRLADWLSGKICERIVTISPPIGEEELAPLLDGATVLLNFAQRQPDQIPAKTFEHLASGREVLCLCEADSDTARLLDSVPGALRVDPDDRPGLLATLRALYRRHVVEGRIQPLRREDILEYSRERQSDLFKHILRDIVEQR
jgi:glycosyltransferase involved in cell wall biosynthesis